MESTMYSWYGGTIRRVPHVHLKIEKQLFYFPPIQRAKEEHAKIMRFNIIIKASYVPAERQGSLPV